MTISVRSPPYLANEELTATCYVSTVPGLYLQNVVITLLDDSGIPISINSSRVILGEVVAVNETIFSRNITVSNLTASDGGNYMCRASVMGPFIYSDEAIATRSLLVEGGKIKHVRQQYNLLSLCIINKYV